MNKKLLLKSFLALAVTQTPVAFAGIGTSLLQTAEIKTPGDYEFKLHADVILDSRVYKNGGSGFNLSPHVRLGVIEHYLDLDAFFGIGTTDFQIGTLAKFNFLPDVDGQVGLSAFAGVSFLRDKRDVENSPADFIYKGLLVPLGLVVSKKIETDFGYVSPYGAYELDLFFKTADDIIAHSLLVGAKWAPTRTDPWHFYSEITLGIHNSLFAVSVGAGQDF